MDKSNRRKFIETAAMLTAAGVVTAVVPAFAGTAGLTNPAAMPLNTMETQYPVVHHVFFWLKNPGSVADRDQLIAGLKTLKKIETIRKLHVGVVASTEKRDVVDNSWSVSELMFFSDLAGQATYQSHPIHLEFIKNCSHLWEKVLVYDAIEV